MGVESPPSPSLGLQVLWWDRKGNWKRAHECVQSNETDVTTAWVRADLHRREGDLSNAVYWCRCAGQPVASGKLDAEWISISASLWQLNAAHALNGLYRSLDSKP